MATDPHHPSEHDGQLLGAFADRRDERAFEEVVRRHAGLVLGVCRRVLGQEADAEDAAQAVFHTLARKAAALRTERCVAAWLHHVARCVARTARSAVAARAKHEREAAAMPTAAGSTTPALDELRERLDHELAALPERYRAPLVLFHLEQRSLADTAQILGRPVGTVGAWLSRGRELLRVRLVRRGGAQVDALTLTALLTAGPAPSAVDIASLSHHALAAVGPTALILSNGALRMLHLAKLKALAATLALAASLVTVGTVAARIGAADSDAGVAAQRDLDSVMLSKISQLESQLIAERRGSVSFADLDRCGVLDIAHETDGSAFIFDGVGHVSDKAVVFFRLSDEERQDLDRVFALTRLELQQRFKGAGAKITGLDGGAVPPDPHDGAVITLPAIGADAETLRMQLHDHLLKLLGAHRGSLCRNILGHYWDDVFLGFGQYPQTMKVWRVGDRLHAEHQTDRGTWGRDYPELPWKYSLFADYLPKKEPAEPAPPKKPDSGF